MTYRGTKRLETSSAVLGSVCVFAEVFVCESLTHCCVCCVTVSVLLQAPVCGRGELKLLTAVLCGVFIIAFSITKCQNVQTLNFTKARRV